MSTNIKAAFELDFDQFQNQFHMPKPNKDDKIILYCMRGNRSTEAANQLVDAGYTEIFNYSGGWVDWTGWGSDFDSDTWKNWKLKIASFDNHKV